MKNRPYQSVMTKKPGRSFFDLSYSKLLTCDMGQLIPIMVDEVVPGDVWKIGNEAIIRMNPLASPALHEINVYVHYFFVPYRLLWPNVRDTDSESDTYNELIDGWECFITRGVDGDQAPEIPIWDIASPWNAPQTLYDYMGFPPNIEPDDNHKPIAFPLYAYNLIYNEFYRDENVIDPFDLDNPAVKRRCWEKDYFTSALPFQQRGTSPALPVSIVGDYDSQAIFDVSTGYSGGAATYPIGLDTSVTDDEKLIASLDGQQSKLKTALEQNTVNVDFTQASATTFDINDLRLAFQIQRFQEMSARAGSRYTEFLMSNFGTAPRDDRLQRPEYIGGSQAPVVISEVLQTSEDNTTPQGNMAGHGISVNRQFCGKYRSSEYGLIMGLMSIMPRTVYTQGIDRQWLRRTSYDFYNPHFANLSEQMIETAEIFVSAVEAENEEPFGFQGNYDEYRTKKNQVVSLMRSDFSHWHCAREFSSAPVLNDNFLYCEPRKDIFAVDTEPGFIVHFGNKLSAVRPIPSMAIPGMIDH
jgi:hypothetical protein